MSNFGKRVSGPPSRRWLKRKRVGIPASAIHADSPTSVLIQDLSLTGARLLGRNLPAAGTRLALKVGSRSLDGEIVWAAGDVRGMGFDFGRR